MALTRDDLATLNEAIATGQKRVRLNNREVEYQSVNQMLKAAAHLKRELESAEIAAGTRVRRHRVYRACTSKGL